MCFHYEFDPILCSLTLICGVLVLNTTSSNLEQIGTRRMLDVNLLFSVAEKYKKNCLSIIDQTIHA